MSKTAPPTACPVYTAAAEATTTGAPGRALGDLDEVKRQAINGAVAALLDWEYSPEAIAATVSRVVGFEVTVEEVEELATDINTTDEVERKGAFL